MSKKLRIAQIAPIAERVPPKKYGGTERVVSTLTEELVKRGHDVTLFATGDSITSARLVSIYPRALREAKEKDPHGINEWSFLNIITAYKKQNEFDIIHDHNWILSLSAAMFSTTPTIMTLHGAITLKNRQLLLLAKNVNFVTISKAQTKFAPGLKIAGVVNNGLVLKNYPFGKKHNKFLLFVGRLSMEKGAHHAIDVATYLNIPLILAAKLDKADMDYFRSYVEPRLGEENVRWIGEVDTDTRNKLMSDAMCILHPVTWREPFGLTMIEAMACGCPVIAFNKGSIPEVVEDGKTGFIVNDIEEMIEAVGKITKIKRDYCREYALNNYSETNMVDGYERIYRKVLKSY